MGRSGRDDAYVGQLYSNAVQQHSYNRNMYGTLREVERMARRLRRERNEAERGLERFKEKAMRKVAQLKVNTKLMYYIFTILYSTRRRMYM